MSDTLSFGLLVHLSQVCTRILRRNVVIRYQPDFWRLPRGSGLPVMRLILSKVKLLAMSDC